MIRPSSTAVTWPILMMCYQSNRSLLSFWFCLPMMIHRDEMSCTWIIKWAMMLLLLGILPCTHAFCPESGAQRQQVLTTSQKCVFQACCVLKGCFHSLFFPWHLFWRAVHSSRLVVTCFGASRIVIDGGISLLASIGVCGPYHSCCG